MRFLKWIMPLAVVAATLMSALPAAADDPFGGPPSTNSGDGKTTWGAIYVADRCTETTKFPANSSTWFKADIWKGYKLQAWLHNVPFWGQWRFFENWTPEQLVRWDNGGHEDAFISGFKMRVYGTDALQPNYVFPGPNNMALLTAPNGYYGDPQSSNPRRIATSGWAEYNPAFPAHLLWYEGQWPGNGWVYLRVYNETPNDYDAQVCTQRVRTASAPSW